jgi:O-acetylhomoserine/O-acetylserine sulfhydrylase-like pyridoxal-dependent enzyme
MDADDVDLIEKSWVEKAKNIVSETMGNPHSQSVEITKMKADYIKKRYNKELKGNE